MNGEPFALVAPPLPEAEQGGPAPALALQTVVPLSAPPARKLHLGHFAFMRSLVEGLDTRDSWNRYLRIEGEHSDIRTVRRTITWIRDAFAAAARRSARYGTARLVLVDVSSLPDSDARLPTLEQFAADTGLEDFSHAEQLEHYKDQYGRSALRGSQRSRLILKQLAALRWLEELVAQPPAAGDPLDCWLHPDLAAHLHGAGLYTLRALVTHINGIGRRWWASIPAIGEGKAARILDWLRAHEASIGVRVGGHVAVPRSKLFADELARIVPRATAIVPLDKFMVPAALNGEHGAFRAPRQHCMMRANNDYDAVLTWIKTRHGVSAEQKRAIQSKRGIDAASAATASQLTLDWLQYLSHTQRAYVKEAERFMLWAIVQHHKPLSSMTLEDCEQYRAFLADPSPSERWCAPRSRQKWSALWRPFEGPLSRSAQIHAIKILKSLYTFLVDQCYLMGNPWNGVSIPKASRVGVNRGRSFSQAQWDFIGQQAALLTDRSADRRLRFALEFYYASGVRLVEGVQARVDDLRWVSYPSPDGGEPVEGWELTVLGKGNKERIVSVPIDVVGALSHYLVSRGLDPDPEHGQNRGAYLIGQAVDVAQTAPWSPRAQSTVDPKAGLAPGTLYGQLKKFFTDCAQVLAATDEKGALRLAAASTHWLRHTHGSHAVAAGMPLDVLQQNMGHASLDTTTGYTTSEERRRMLASQQFWEGAGARRATAPAARAAPSDRAADAATNVVE
jgi:site-specific recombinase XerD